MIGLSVSFCVREIADGKVSLNQVEKIVAGTLCADPEAWEEVIERYRHSHWTNNPDECERIFRQLLAEGKVSQPRLETHMAPNLSVRNAHGGTDHWVNTESEIKWKFVI